MGKGEERSGEEQHKEKSEQGKYVQFDWLFCF